MEATARCFLEILRLEVIPYSKAGLSTEQFQNFQEKNPKPFELIGLNIEPYKPIESKANEDIIITEDNLDKFSNTLFAHLHVHSQFSILQATIGLELENNRFNLNPYFLSSLLFDKQNTVDSFQKE